MRHTEVQRKRRHKRIRAVIKGTAKRPRVSVYRSNKYVYVQFVEDEGGKTVLGVSDNQKEFEKKGASKVDRARELGKIAARQAKKKGVSRVVFDRGGFSYTGRIRALAEGLREGGLIF